VSGQKSLEKSAFGRKALIGANAILENRNYKAKKTPA
jgi:hypothetical protein